MPVEVPGASYGVEEEQAIATVFKPLNITWEVTDATLDQAEVISRMSDYLTANRKKIKAIIGLGDLVTGSIKRVFDQVGVKPGEIPVVGWGNSLDTTGEVMEGYVNAGRVAGSAGDELPGARPAPIWRRTAFRPASTSSSARSTIRTPRPSTTRSCRASSKKTQFARRLVCRRSETQERRILVFVRLDSARGRDATGGLV